jgi:hypothetical protein
MAKGETSGPRKNAAVPVVPHRLAGENNPQDGALHDRPFALEYTEDAHTPTSETS